MAFSSNVFLFLFLPAVVILYFNPFLKTRTFRNVVLLLASIGFYAWGEPLFVFLMLLTALLNWFIGLRISSSRRHKKQWMWTAVVCDLALLGVFKYLTFLTENIAWLTGNDGIIVEIALPIGISFFTFQMMSYIFDVTNGTAQAQKNPLNVLLYITMFPQLIAGPIVRYQTVAEEIQSRQETLQNFTDGLTRFVYGLGKKVLLADYLAVFADAAFQADTLSVGTAWLGALCYTLQIYFDFSGYSDMAIGLGLIFGFHFPENFNYPYIAKSVHDFWRRWHISLSSWFRDYVYIPLGGSRVSRGRWVLNLFAVWLLTGIWHGANWTFLVWGLLYFCFLLAETWIGIDKIEKHCVLSRVYTLLLVSIAWVIFRAASLPDALEYLGCMSVFGASGLTDSLFFKILSSGRIILPLALLLSCPVYQKLKAKLSSNQGQIMDSVLLITVFSLSVLRCVRGSYSPFIYFNF